MAVGDRRRHLRHRVGGTRAGAACHRARERRLVIEPFSVTGRRLHTDATGEGGGAGSTTRFYD